MGLRRPMPLTLLAERRNPSGECLINTAKPEGSRPAATRTQSQSECHLANAKTAYAISRLAAFLETMVF